MLYDTAPRLARLLRAEGLGLFVISLIAYRHFGGVWGWGALGFFLPDLAMLAYLVGPRAGAWGYNIAHSTIAPLLLGAAGLAGGSVLAAVAALWLAHIGFDRALGYGLKGESFGHTHLRNLGRAPRSRWRGALT